MLHTVLITNRIYNIKMYNEIYKSLLVISKNNGVELYKSDIGYVTHALKNKGFTEIVLIKKYTQSKYTHPILQLTIQLNPTKLLNKNIVELTKEEDLQEVEQKFNEVLEQIHFELNTFFYWTLNRIDYCINIKTPYVKEYIKLFQRSSLPYRFNIPYDKKAKVRKHQKGSFYIYNNSTTINFYDKEVERLNNTGKWLENAKDILRLEIQCKKAKTDYMKYKYKFDIKYLGYFTSEELSNKTIATYFDKIIGKGDYYKLDKARAIINSSKHTKATKDKLINVLELINKHKSIDRALKESNYTKGSFNRYIREIRSLNINPITIPRRECVDYLKAIDISKDKV